MGKPPLATTAKRCTCQIMPSHFGTRRFLGLFIPCGPMDHFSQGEARVRTPLRGETCLPVPLIQLCTFPALIPMDLHGHPHDCPKVAHVFSGA